MEALGRQGVPTTKIELNQDITLDPIKAVQIYGIYPFSFERVLKYFKEENIKIVYDLDDATDWVDTTNPFYYSVKRDAGSQLEILKYADCITVSTPNIANYVRAKSDKPVIVVPNCFVPSEWTTPRVKQEGMRIGFAGSPTHFDDLLLVLPTLERLQKKYNVTFVLMGFGTGDYDSTLKSMRFVSAPEGIKAADEFDRLMKNINVEWVPNVDFQLYPQVLTNLSLDIGICPLVSTPFNDARSASKAMEYTLSGALAVASDVEPYRADPTSILCRDDEWYDTLERLITHPSEIESNRLEHLKWIKKHRDIDSPEMVDLLKSIYVV